MAVLPNNNEFKDFSQEAQTHTKYCHERSIKKATVQSWKTAIPDNADTGFETSYFKRWKRIDFREGTASKDDCGQVGGSLIQSLQCDFNSAQ